MCAVSTTYCISVSRMLIMYDANTNATTVVGSIHEGNTDEEITFTSSLFAHPRPFYSRLLDKYLKTT
jgi:hypothetical protein